MKTSNEDSLELLINLGHAPANEAVLRDALAQHVNDLQDFQFGALELIRNMESAVEANPEESVGFDSENNATLIWNDQQWNAGTFSTPTLDDLRNQVAQQSVVGNKSRVRLFLLDGISPFTDIGSLQATCGKDTLFQVASQFNCLESVGEFITPVAHYVHDNTQGPRASISALPATLLRHYQAPDDDGTRFTQSTNGRQINLLERACDQHFVNSGYLTGSGMDDPHEFLRQLNDNFEHIKVGVHENVQVIFGHNWYGVVDREVVKPIAQVFTSTIAGGGYGGENLPTEVFHSACRQLLRAAYLGTLLAAVSTGKKRVVLTLIGGGVFHNPFQEIWDAILWSLDEIESCITSDLDVIVNGFDLGRQINVQQTVAPSIQKWNGLIFTFDKAGLVKIDK